MKTCSYVLITSRNKNWKGEIEEVGLDDGFCLGEAIIFIKKVLKIEDSLQDDYVVDLAKALSRLPLALVHATAYIKQENIVNGEFKISDYLGYYKVAMKGQNFAYFEEQGITKELFMTLKTNFDKMKQEKDIGQQSHDMLCLMTYLSPSHIDIEELFLRQKPVKDRKWTCDAIDLLKKFSMIELQKSIARIHKGAQEAMKSEKKREGKEEEALRKAMKLVNGTTQKDTSHIISVWSHASEYDKLVNEFIDSTYDGNNILHLVVKNGNEKVIKLILDKIDSSKLSKVIDDVDQSGFAPLHYAAAQGELKIVEYLVKKGANLKIDNDGMPLHYAAKFDKLDVVVYFIDNKHFDVDIFAGDDETPLLLAIQHGHLDVTKYLVERGASVNIDEYGNSPLHEAVTNSHLDIVEYLVKQGVTVDLEDEDNMTPLHWAVIKGYSDIAQYLVREGAEVNLQDKHGKTPLHFAANGPLEIVQLLLEKKAEVNLQDEGGRTPLYWAVINGHLDIVEYLVKEKAEVNLQDKYGRTPLYWAIRGGYLDIAKCLLEQGATVDPKSKDFEKLLNFATINGQLGVVRYLERQSLLNSSHSGSCSSQSQKRKRERPETLSKKRKLESMSATSEKNASSMQLPQGSQDTVNLLSEMGRLSVKLQHRLGLCAQGKISTQFESHDGPEISVEYFRHIISLGYQLQPAKAGGLKKRF